MKQIKLQITEDMISEIQAIGSDIDTRTHVIDAMFEKHKNDVNDSVFTSIPFMSYQKMLVESKIKYEQAIKELGLKLIPIVQEKTGKDDINFDWNIEDFSKLEVDITIK